MRFEQFQYLWLILPALALPTALWLFGRLRLDKLLWGLSFAFMALAAARPQLGHHGPATEPLGGDLFLVFDISRSMLARDIPPSRIRFSTLFAEKLIQAIPHYRFAIYPFAGEGYLQTPLTHDCDALIEMLGYLSPDLVTNPSSHLDRALIKLYDNIQRLQSTPAQVIVFSDGELQRPVQSTTLDLYKRAQIAIHTIGTATTAGSPLPIDTGPLVASSGSMRNHVSRLFESSLRDIARHTGGSYHPAHLEQVPILASILSKTAQSTVLAFKSTHELFPYCIAVAVILYVYQFTKRRWALLLRGLLLVAFMGHVAQAGEQVFKKRSSNRGSYIIYNEAIDHLEHKDASMAEQSLHSAIGTAHRVEVKKRALYNLGNLYMEQGELITALEYYQLAWDLTLPSAPAQAEMNRRISENMALAARLVERRSSQTGDKDGNQGPPDPRGPKKQFQSEQFSEEQKRQLFELLANEERQTLQRIFESRNRKKPMEFTDSPW